MVFITFMGDTGHLIGLISAAFPSLGYIPSQEEMAGPISGKGCL